MQSANGNGKTDVVVIGGGPAGSAPSTLIAQKGYRVKALLLRKSFRDFTSANR